MRIKELLIRQRESSKIAIVQGSKSISYHDWYHMSEMIMNLLSSELNTGAHSVAIFLENSIEYAIAYYAIALTDKIVVPIGIEAKEIELVNTLEYCEINLIISSKNYNNILCKLSNGFKHKIVVLFIEDNSYIVLNKDKEYIGKNPIMDEGQDNLDDVAIMLHTSGTTSNPKRVMLTHSNLINNIESNINSLNLSEDDKVLISMPMYFGYCNTAQFLTHLYLGATMVILDGIFLPKMFFKTIQEQRITNFTGVPSMLLMILEYRYANKYDISSLKYICFGGGKMPIEKLKKLIEKFPSVGFVQTYGQTEASPRVTALLPKDSLRKLGSVGKSIPNVLIKVVDESGIPVQANKIGEVIIQGKNVMKGYYKQKLITQKTIVSNWLYSGDLGYIDDEGFLFLTGRKRNIIISGGVNIYPEEIEETLLQHDNVLEAYVTSREHELLGEIPIAKIVVKDKSVLNIEYKQFCVERLSVYKIPKQFIVVEKLDKTYNGKIKRDRRDCK